MHIQLQNLVVWIFRATRQRLSQWSSLAFYATFHRNEILILLAFQQFTQRILKEARADRKIKPSFWIFRKFVEGLVRMTKKRTKLSKYWRLNPRGAFQTIRNTFRIRFENKHLPSFTCTVAASKTSRCYYKRAHVVGYFKLIVKSSVSLFQQLQKMCTLIRLEHLFIHMVPK